MDGVATAVLAAWLAQAVLATLGCAWFRRLLARPQPRPAAWPGVLVLVPVRGVEPCLQGFLDALTAQDYPDWRAVFVLEDARDPAHTLLTARVVAAPERFALCLAGTADRRGQKVHNLLAGLGALRPDDAAMVTLDADTLPPPGLLRTLLRPVVTGQAPIASGYRWTRSVDGRLGSRLLAAVDLGIATLPRHAALNLCWGGATAIGRGALDRLDLPRVWDRAVSDDLALSRDARRLGLAIYAPLNVRPPSPVAADATGALAFGTRQYRLLRLHAPRRWALAGGLIMLPVAGTAAALWLGAGLALAAIVALGLTRDALRASIARRLAVPAAPSAMLLRPPAALLHLAAWIASARGRDLRWAGRHYRLAPDGMLTSPTPTAPDGRPVAAQAPSESAVPPPRSARR